MEKLEKTLGEVESRTESIKPLLEKSTYEGFQKIEDKVYTGGTSIKYWM